MNIKRISFTRQSHFKATMNAHFTQKATRNRKKKFGNNLNKWYDGTNEYFTNFGNIDSSHWTGFNRTVHVNYFLCLPLFLWAFFQNHLIDGKRFACRNVAVHFKCHIGISIKIIEMFANHFEMDTNDQSPNGCERKKRGPIQFLLVLSHGNRYGILSKRVTKSLPNSQMACVSCLINASAAFKAIKCIYIFAKLNRIATDRHLHK